jgi:hypothetical protein
MAAYHFRSMERSTGAVQSLRWLHGRNVNREELLDAQALIVWLIAQPPFIQVGASLIFFLFAAPAVLTIVALATERVERLIARAIHPWIPRPSLTNVVGHVGRQGAEKVNRQSAQVGSHIRS